MGQNLPGKINPLLRQFLIRQGLRPGYEQTTVGVYKAACAVAVFKVHHLRRVPVLPKGERGDAAMSDNVTVEIGGTLPGAHSHQMRRLE